jgi:monooxygenase
MRAGPILDLTSGYVRRSVADLPKVGDRPPWTMPQSYLHDRRAFPRADLTQDMVFHPFGASAAGVPSGAPAPAVLAADGDATVATAAGRPVPAGRE